MWRLRRAALRILNLVRSGRAERDLAREIASHLSALEDEFARRGMPAEQARLEARRAFGGIEQVKEQQRDARSFVWLDHAWRDVRFAVRTLVRTPGFSAAAILCLALGIGANTAVFSVFNAVLLRPLPFADPDRLVHLFETSGDGPRSVVGGTEFLTWRDENRSFDSMAAYQRWTSNLTGVDVPETLVGVRASGGLFDLLGVRPAAGRVILPEDETRQLRVVVLSHRLWQRAFHGDPALVGRSVRLDGESYLVVGIMPADFQFPSREVELWAPLTLDPRELDPGSYSVSVVARVRRLASLEQARADLNRLMARLEQQFPRTFTGVRADLTPLRDWYVGGTSLGTLWLLIGAVGLVLLSACANVASLLLARGYAREQELVVRMALGAGRRRVFSQLLTESLVLGLAGGVLGLAGSIWGRDLLVFLLPSQPVYRLLPPVIDWRVLSFSFVISAASAIVFGLVPARRAVRVNLTPGPSTRVAPLRVRGILVAVQAATAVLLLVGTALLARSFLNLWHVDPGFSRADVVAAQIALPGRYPEHRQVEFYDRLIERVSAAPGVQAAGAVTNLPLGGGSSSGWISFEGRPELHNDETRRPGANRLIVTPGFFQTLQIPLLKGRTFTAEDTATALPVVIISRSLANRYYPNQDPIGQRMKRGTPAAPFPWLTIVGVADDLKQFSLLATAGPTIYLPRSQFAVREMTVVARTSTGRDTLAGQLLSILKSIDPDQPVGWIRTYDDIVLDALGSRRFPMLWAGVFAGLALTLTALGVHGVVSYAVARRHREFGIRLALGARPSELVRLAVWQGILPTLVGTAIGMLTAVGLSQLLANLVFGIPPRDVVSFASAGTLLLLVAFVASYPPARRIAQQDPTTALRHE